MSDARRDDTRGAADGTHMVPAAPAGGPDLDCNELPDLLVKLHLADDAFDDQPELRRSIEAHIATCRSCRRKSDSLRSILAAIAAPSRKTAGRHPLHMVAKRFHHERRSNAMNRDDGIDDIYRTKIPILGAGGESHRVASPDLREGARLFGRYVCGRKLGAGGMGHVYLVHDLVTRLLCAMKLIIPRHDCPEARHRFRREITIQRRFLHPNIVAVHDFGMPTPDQHGFIVMKYIDGPNLEEVINYRGKMTLDMIAALVEQGGTALEVVHGAGILHRDIKPSNIFMTTLADGRPLFKLGDFGVAKDLVDPDFSFRTKSNALVGTPLYLAPEVLYGGEPTHRADLFAFGIVVARAATAMTTREVICWANQPFPPSLPGLPDEASAVLARALAITPSGRPERAGDFAREFLRSLRSSVATRRKPRRSWAAGFWSLF